MLLDNDKEEIRKMIRESVTEALTESKKEIQDGVKAAILGAKNEQRLTKEQIMAVKSRTERQKLINENMDLFK